MQGGFPKKFQIHGKHLEIIITCNYFSVCILFPEVSYYCSTYNVLLTICSHMLPRTLRCLDDFEPMLWELMPSPASSLKRWRLVELGAW